MLSSPVFAQPKKRVLASARGEIENNGFLYLATLTRPTPCLSQNGHRIKEPEGDVTLRISRIGAPGEPPISLKVGYGATAKLAVRDLTGDGSVDVFVFVDGQATSAHVYRFSGRKRKCLLAIESGRPQVECWRMADGEWGIVEHGRLDSYDDVPPAVARRARVLARGHSIPMVRRVYGWDGKRGRFRVREVVAEGA